MGKKLLLYSMGQEQLKKSRHVRSLFESLLNMLNKYGDTPDCTNLHMSLLHQSVLLIVIFIP